MLGKIEGKRRSGQQRMIWLDGITDSMGDSGGPWSTGLQRIGHNLVTEQQQQFDRIVLKARLGHFYPKFCR